MIREAGTVSQKIARYIFSLLLCSQESLQISAIVGAIPTSEFEKHFSQSDIVEICADLVVLDKRFETLRFARVTVQEYLANLVEFSGPKAHRLVADRCLESCVMGISISANHITSPGKSFTQYSAIYWPYHYAKSDERYAGTSQRVAMEQFIFEDTFDVSLSFLEWLD